jgi:hypothetical protein
VTEKALELFFRHHLLVLRGQSNDMDQLGAFAWQFGELEENIVYTHEWRSGDYFCFGTTVA